jgi:hypothetical protein
LMATCTPAKSPFISGGGRPPGATLPEVHRKRLQELALAAADSSTAAVEAGLQPVI